MTDFIGYCVASSVIYYYLRKIKYFDDFYVLKEFFVLYKAIMMAILVYIIFFSIIGAVWIVADEQYHGLLWLITLYFLYESIMIFHILTTYIFTRWVFKQLQNDSALQSEYSEVLRKLSYHHTAMKKIASQVEMAEMDEHELMSQTPSTSK